MSSQFKEFVFTINAFTPETIPMARLAEYMADLAVLLGEKDSVHFNGLQKGSTKLKTIIEHEAEPKIRERVRLVHANAGPTEAQNAFKSINRRLKEDNGDAVFQDYNTAEIISFPGAKEPVIPVFGPISQSGTIDGVIIRIGGKNEMVTVTLQTRDGLEAPCRIKRQMGKELGPYIFDQEMRFSGTGKWTRNEEGSWILDSFFITGYEVLDDRSLVETVSDLRAVKGSQWSKVADPWKELSDLRGEE